MKDGEGIRINISHNFGLKFSAECPSSNKPFKAQSKELIIRKSSNTPLVPFTTATIHSSDDSVSK
jgi:hypothetical protein